MPLDHYTLRARLQPALIVLLPILLAVFAWYPPDKLPLVALWSLLGLTGVTFLLAHVARDSGKQKEPGLWREWGGKPTTQRLRHSTAPNKVTLERYHEKLGMLLHRSFPTIQEERDDLGDCEAVYDAAVTVLRDSTRDKKKYPLVYKELVNYGFRRNLFGMRPAGILVCILSLGASGAAAYVTTNVILSWGAIVITAVLLSWWLLRIDSEWVKTTAFDYADRLLESCERL